jgi:hypothetical protein
MITPEMIREAWADDPEGIGRAVYELTCEALALPGAIVPEPGEHMSMRVLDDDLRELLIGERRLTVVPVRTIVERGREIVRRAE